MNAATTISPESGVRNLVIRSMRAEDREPLNALLIGTGVFNSEEIAIALELIDAVISNPDHKDYIIRVCVDRGEVLGYYCIGPTPATKGTFDLYWIAVKLSAQGKGVGAQLDAHAVASARSMGARLLHAETSSRPDYDNTRKFYIARGYSELARIRDYYNIGDDLVVYGKYLTS